MLSLPAGVALGAALLAGPQPREAGPVAELLEDDAAGLLKELTNPTGDPGQGHVEKEDFFSGKEGVKIIPMQRFHPSLPGWKFVIRKDPKPGEYRYVRFAWRADGCRGIMLQFHDLTGWNLRYTAGVDQYNWGSKFVAKEPPGRWTVVTRDLFADFGERTLQGIALTAFNGKAGYFDHIYLGRSVEALDRVDATGFGKRPQPKLTDAELARLWDDLAGEDERKAYSALWRLVAAPEQASELLEDKLVKKVTPDSARYRRWIEKLDSRNFDERQRAFENLRAAPGEVTQLLDEALRASPSPEARLRLNRLLARRGGPGAERRSVSRGVRVLEYVGTRDSQRVLRLLSRKEAGAVGRDLARAALGRMEQGSPAP